MTEDNRIGVVILTLMTTPPEEHLQVLEGIHTGDRPAAVGYFMLDVMRDAFRRLKMFPEARLRIGSVDAAQIKLRRTQGYDIRSPLVHGGVPSAILGEIYKTVLAVERGDEGLLNS